MPQPNSDATKVLAAAAGPIAKWCTGWYLFGAQAAISWGVPRSTGDADITVRLPRENVAAFCEAMGEAGFRLRVRDAAFIERTRVLPFVHSATEFPLDVVLAGPGPEETFIERAIIQDFEGVAVPVASPEDVIIMKVLAGRPKDIEDLRAIIFERHATLDAAYIRSMLDMLEKALSQADLLPRFESEWTRIP